MTATATDPPVLRLQVQVHPVPDAEAPYDDAPAVLRVVTEPAALDSGTPAVVHTPRGELEHPGPRATVLARAVLEAIAGDRPLAQLAPWTVPEVYDELAPLVCSRTPRPWAATLRRVVVCEPVPGVAEVTAVVQRGPRAGLLALRLESVDGRWLMTAVCVG